MNSESDKQGAALPISGLLTVVFFIAGAIFLGQLPLRSSRPPEGAPLESPVPEAQKVKARLWEDPFTAIARHEEEEKKSGRTPLPDGHLSLKGSLPELHRTDRLDVLGVMVFGGDYSELRETRRRWRYAVLSSLHAFGLVPTDAEHIGYFRAEGTDCESKVPTTIPYESFEDTDYKSFEGKESKRAALVLWLDEDAFDNKPLDGTACLMHLLRDDPKGPGLDWADVHFSIVGPAGSTGLRAMVEEARRKPPPSVLADLAEVNFFSATATAEVMVDGTTAEKFLKTHGIRLSRTTTLDMELMRDIVNELKLRGVDPTRCTGGKDRIALISEWDTEYGRELPKSFIEAVQRQCEDECKKSSPAAGQDPCGRTDWVDQFTYLRGLDAQVAGSLAPDRQRGGSSPGSNEKDGNQQTDIERAEGDSQVDYLRRLAASLRDAAHERARRGEGRIGAIGVLGSDIYDKLLVLQALRGYFPDALFFTTDLDARYLHPYETQWTRNLLVASHFGLELDPLPLKSAGLTTSHRSPLFRDTYQTAVFFAASLALREETDEPVDGEAIRASLQPQLYEIGRTSAVDLPRPTTDRLGQRRAEESNGWLAALRQSVLILVALALLGTLTGLLVEGFRHFVLNAGAGILSTVRRCPLLFVALGLLVVSLVSAVVLSDYRLEPFVWFEGVSAWPSEILRLIAIVLSMTFLCGAWRNVAAIQKGIGKCYFSGQVAASEPPKLSWIGCLSSVVSLGSFPESDRASDAWNHYCAQGSLRARWCRVAVLSVLHLCLGVLLMLLFGLPGRPVRGPAPRNIDLTLLAVSVVLLVALIFFVVDAIRLCIGWVRALARTHIWPEGAQREYGERYGLDPELLDARLDISIIAEHTTGVQRLIYYPFIVLLLMIVSRSTIFDAWHTPAGLLLIIFLNLLYAVGAAVMLHAAVEKARRSTLECLRDKLRPMKCREDAQSKHATCQLEWLVSWIESVREGAFSPFTQRPWVRAVLVPISGYGGVTLIEFGLRYFR